jgi:beta-phosphoglucomutase-like phosphatase (HAD superfamily)
MSGVSVDAVDAICFDPVGTLADFPARPFLAAALHVFARELPAHDRGSHAYWDLVELLTSCDRPLAEHEQSAIEAAEMEAADAACLYDDAGPALGELAALGVRLLVTSSLSERALGRFLDRAPFRALFSEVWSRDAAGGVGDVVLRRAVANGVLIASRVLFLTDTGKGLQAARRAGVLPMLMMNDPDEAMRLTSQEPAGGIISLHELPDMVRLVAARQRR